MFDANIPKMLYAWATEPISYSDQLFSKNSEPDNLQSALVIQSIPKCVNNMKSTIMYYYFKMFKQYTHIINKS